MIILHFHCLWVNLRPENRRFYIINRVRQPKIRPQKNIRTWSNFGCAKITSRLMLQWPNVRLRRTEKARLICRLTFVKFNVRLLIFLLEIAISKPREIWPSRNGHEIKCKEVVLGSLTAQHTLHKQEAVIAVLTVLTLEPLYQVFQR